METFTRCLRFRKIEGNATFTRLDAALELGPKNSLWPMPMGLACCAIELMADGRPVRYFDILAAAGSDEIFAAAVRRHDCRRHRDLQDGAGG